MNGKEIVNLIDDLRSKGLSDTQIIETIKYIELNDPKLYQQQSNSGQQGGQQLSNQQP